MAHKQHDDHRSSPPRSIEELSGIAQVPFDARLAIKSYVRSCEMLYQQAKKDEEQLELAYIYLSRAARIIIHDLPSHPDYHQLPPSYQAQLKADGLKYLEALLPIKSKLKHQHQLYQQQHSFSPSQSSSLSNTPPQPHQHPKQKSSISDWTLIDSPELSYEPLLPKQQQHCSPHNKLHKNHHLSSPITRRSSSSKSSPSTCSDSSTSVLPSAAINNHRIVNPLVWPVELGNGLGRPMTVALPHHNRPSSHRNHHQLSVDLPDSSPPTREHPHSSKKNPLASSQPISSRSFRHLGLYELQDPPSPSHQASSPPSLNRSATQKQQAQDSLKAKKQRASWADRRPLPASATTTDPQEPSQSLARSFRSLLRPRRLSWSSASPTAITKPRRAPSVESWASVQIPSPPPPAVGLESPAHILTPLQQQQQQQQQTRSRSRRGSLGEPASWRWLKALKSSPDPSSPSTSQQPTSNGPLYTHFPALISPELHPSRPRLPSLPSPSPSSSSTAPPIHHHHHHHHHHRKAQRETKRRKQLLCPAQLVGAFVAMAEPQTAQGIELCGLLLGSTIGDRLVVNTLLIPRQISTANSCHTVDEAQTFEVQSRAGLLTLGWIHTHPTQTCFLSSVDLHTHLSYHLMLPESVAIVCSPNKHPSVGVFKLVEPSGVDFLRQCPNNLDAFHPHDLPDNLLYTTPTRNEFVFVEPDGHDVSDVGDGDGGNRRTTVGLDFEIIDLRGPE
ncbi:hypothetical protein PGT21_020134 [Puccinia graminis f. sp. tritici]|uniref:MPN domain-containing protein n=1 Tax=Puccinia graminis f. sp. tritici TaxID=56615 RepID=A0A5B0M041_PUCGR|nr:hypothetical protein PGT21_020134 [Puccinia graminis f. sp. tritici]